jgi:PKD repeat protein
MDMVHPMHKYVAEGEYTVGLFGFGNGGADMMVIPNMIYVDTASVELALEGGSETVPGEEWDNAIDHDVVSSNACATGMNTGDAHVVFSFADGMEKMLHKVRIAPKAICPHEGRILCDVASLRSTNIDDLLVNSPRLIGSKTNLAKDFQILVSADSLNWDVGFEGTLETKCDFEIFEFDAVAARYIKLVLLNARGEDSPYVSICEFQAFATPMVTPIAIDAEAGSNTTSVGQLPTEYGLSANYPNPFNPETTISYQLPEVSDVMLHIYNVQGQKIATLVNERKDAGSYQVVWNGTNDFGQEVAGGMYIYKIVAANADNEVFTVSRKMTFLK